MTRAKAGKMRSRKGNGEHGFNLKRDCHSSDTSGAIDAGNPKLLCVFVFISVNSDVVLLNGQYNK